MPKYRNKPVEVEVFKYNGDLMDRCGKYYVPEWAGKAFEQGVMFYKEMYTKPAELFIETLEGDHHVSIGDYIIKGVQGELYPCKPDIFLATYKEVEV